MKQEEILGGFDSANYTVERLMAPARDGVAVPISLVYRKGIERDGSNPALLYAYGSYGSSSEARFRSAEVSLLDRGFIFAVAHIRGGQEMGRWWYEDGKLLEKKNTFTDFVDCGRYLVDQGYTSPDRLFARGGSAGGLLMGAVSNMAPELFAGIIAHVPFVDVVTTMLDHDIPLTTAEFDEWGNPENRDYYDYMLSYSPYDNVEVKDYPAMLVTTALEACEVGRQVAHHEDRRQPAHSQNRAGGGGPRRRQRPLRAVPRNGIGVCVHVGGAQRDVKTLKRWNVRTLVR
jgi:oligopeptidase B